MLSGQRGEFQMKMLGHRDNVVILVACLDPADQPAPVLGLAHLGLG